MEVQEWQVKLELLYNTCRRMTLSAQEHERLRDAAVYLANELAKLNGQVQPQETTAPPPDAKAKS